MRAEDRPVRVGDLREDGSEELAELIRHAVTHRVRQVHGPSAGVDHGLDDAAQKVDVAPHGVFRRELDVVGVAERLLHTRHRRRQALIARDMQLLFQVQVGGGDKGMNPRPLRLGQNLPGAIDVLLMAAGQSRDDGPADAGGNLPHALGIVLGRDWKARLDDIHAKRVQLQGQPNLFRGPHRVAWRLLAVAQGGVKYCDPVCSHVSSLVRFTAGPVASQVYIRELVIKKRYTNEARRRRMRVLAHSWNLLNSASS
jgi:hypothetical protein